MKPLLITSLLALAAPVASANDIVDFHRKLFRTHNQVRRIVHRTVHRSLHVRHHGRRTHRRRYCRQAWAPVRYETVRHREYVPGRVERVWHPTEYATRYNRCGNRYRIVIRRGHYYTVRTNAHYEWRNHRVRRGGYYEFTCNTVGHRHARRR